LLHFPFVVAPIVSNPSIVVVAVVVVAAAVVSAKCQGLQLSLLFSVTNFGKPKHTGVRPKHSRPGVYTINLSTDITNFGPQ
jgi:hypothetical protein